MIAGDRNVANGRGLLASFNQNALQLQAAAKQNRTTGQRLQCYGEHPDSTDNSA
jgi:hypothetical protein